MSLRKKVLFIAATALAAMFVVAARYGPDPTPEPEPRPPCGCVFPGTPVPAL